MILINLRYFHTSHLLYGCKSSSPNFAVIYCRFPKRTPQFLRQVTNLLHKSPTTSTVKKKSRNTSPYYGKVISKDTVKAVGKNIFQYKFNKNYSLENRK